MHASSHATRNIKRLTYLPGLDGLRALAVIAVLLYHADLPIRGGFLGVEAFFVISGFLITALLLTEWQQHSQIDLFAFWIRRARRLLPALFFVLAGTLLFAGFFLRGERMDLLKDTLAALAYVMNWRLIFSAQSYFDPLLRPSLLRHLWSLAVEEQFYLFWPLLFAAGMRWLRVSRLLVVILAVAFGSALLMAWLYRPGIDPSRIYYGTDTRLTGLLLGAALAMILPIGSDPTGGKRYLGRLLDGAGMLALSGLIVSFGWLSTQHPLLYRGGFVLVAILTAIVIAALTQPHSRLTHRIIGWPLLRGIGVRSYGIYLWHWPVFMVTRPYIDLPFAGLPLLALRLVIVGIFVEVSYRYIELPIRQGAQPWRELALVTRAHWLSTRQSYRRASALTLLTVLIASLVLVSLGSNAGARRALPITTRTTSTVIAQRERTAATTIPTLPDTLPAPGPTVIDATSPDMSGAAATLPPAGPTAVPAAPQPLDPALVAALQALLDDTVANGFVPGASLSISIPGYLPWSGASGMADVARDVPMEPNTLIRAASITKMFTAVVVLQLAEEGKINLQAPIGTWLPDIVPLADSTTVRQLLNHTSGIYDYLEDPQFYAQAYGNPDRVWTPDELVALVDQYGAAFDPGTEGMWKYASTNYVILGMLVEQVTGKSLAEEMRQRIFDPLELRHTFFAPQETLQGNVAEGYIDASDRADVSMTFVFATGNIVSTPNDLRQFVDALFNDQLLTAESRSLMTTMTDTGGAYDMPELEYGLGLMRARLNVGPGPTGAQRPDAISTVLGHIGGIAGFRSAVWRVPESGITIALSVNQADIDPNLLARDTLDLILQSQGR